MSKYLLMLCLSFLTVPAMAEELVVLIHGIGRSGASFNKMAYQLEQAGYRTLKLDYPSTSQPLEEIARTITPTIQNAITAEVTTVHFVTHSMGGLVFRTYMGTQPSLPLGRVVMLAPPNHGSEVADFLQRHFNPVFKFFYGPAGQQLTTTFDGSQIFAPVTYELGIIAGTRSWMPLSSYIIPGVDDGKVSLPSSKLAGAKAHTTLPVTHTFMMNNKDVIAATLAFLKVGTFKK